MCIDEGRARPEKDSCRTCANRVRCHGQVPEVTKETILQLIDQAIREVIHARRSAKKPD